MTEETKTIGSTVFTEDINKTALEINSTLGKELIKGAIGKYQEEKKKEVIAEVENILERIQVMERIQRNTELRLILLRDQMGAINDGKFTLRDATYWSVSRIKFDEERLNIDWSETEKW